MWLRTSLIAVVLLASSVRADTVQMRDGTTVQGKYLGGTSSTIRFEAAEGIKVLETSKVSGVTFSVNSASPTTAPSADAFAASATVAPSAPPQPITMPAGTILTIKLDSAVSS